MLLALLMFLVLLSLSSHSLAARAPHEFHWKNPLQIRSPSPPPLSGCTAESFSPDFATLPAAAHPSPPLSAVVLRRVAPPTSLRFPAALTLASPSPHPRRGLALLTLLALLLTLLALLLTLLALLLTLLALLLTLLALLLTLLALLLSSHRYSRSSPSTHPLATLTLTLSSHSPSSPFSLLEHSKRQNRNGIS